MRLLARVLGGRALLISQEDRDIDDFVHPTGDSTIDIGTDIWQTVEGIRCISAPKLAGWRYIRNTTNLEYTSFKREADGVAMSQVITGVTTVRTGT
ncbi:MAG: hypothetical protein R3E64_04055 [Halioglobus sp.]